MSNPNGQNPDGRVLSDDVLASYREMADAWTLCAENPNSQCCGKGEQVSEYEQQCCCCPDAVIPGDLAAATTTAMPALLDHAQALTAANAERTRRLGRWR